MTELGSKADLSWMDSALCAQTDPEAFFPEKGGSTAAAKKVCMACDVRAECDEYAPSVDARFGEFGVWAGKSAQRRRKDNGGTGRQSAAERAAQRDWELFEASERAMEAGLKLFEYAAKIRITAGALEAARLRHRRRVREAAA